MHARSLFAPDPNFLLASRFNAAVPRNPPPPKRLAAVCAASKRNRYGMAKSGKLMLESAYIVASHLRILPEPVMLLLREFGAGNGGRNGFWGGFGRGGSDGWRGRGRRRARFGFVGILAILGAAGVWWIARKEMVPDSDALLGGLGLVLFGLSAEAWGRGARDWILGFCCCAVMVGLVSSKGDSGELLRSFGSLKKGLMRRRRSKGRGF